MNADNYDETPASQHERACQQLRNDILEGEFPPLSKLNISTLKDRYATSIGPVREALSRLTAEGLVIRRGLKGYWAAPVSLDEFRDITRMRIMLEVDALSRSIRNGDLVWEARVVGALHRLKSIQATWATDSKLFAREEERENREFHKSLISRCPSTWQLKFIDTLYDQSARYRTLSLVKRPSQPDMEQREHGQIMKAALARDEEKACRILVQHIESSSDSVIAAVFGGPRAKRAG